MKRLGSQPGDLCRNREQAKAKREDTRRRRRRRKKNRSLHTRPSAVRGAASTKPTVRILSLSLSLSFPFCPCPLENSLTDINDLKGLVQPSTITHPKQNKKRKEKKTPISVPVR